MHALLPVLPLLPLLAGAASPAPRHHPGPGRKGVAHPHPEVRYPHHVDRYRRVESRRDVVDGVVLPESNGTSSLGAVADPGYVGTTVVGSTGSSSSGASDGSNSASQVGSSALKNSTSGAGGSSGNSSSAACFPMGGATLPSSGAAPSAAPSEWWCGAEREHGFLGFSHALESTDCNDPTNQKGTLVKTFAAMKKDYGASMIRIYAPECRQESFWTDVLEASAENNMAVIPMVWWGFANQDLWKQSAAQLVKVAQTNKLAKYVFHSVAFGSEPIGDGVDGGYQQFTKDLTSFRAQMNKAGIKVAISEDWDRPGIMTQGEFDNLASTGEAIKQNTDLVMAHIMPYYHADEVATAFDAWPYFEKYVKFLKAKVQKQILITESPWSSTTSTYHGRGADQSAENLPNFKFYWTSLLGGNEACTFFKQNGVGWFMHTYSDEFESGFGLLSDSNKPIINFAPVKC